MKATYTKENIDCLINFIEKNIDRINIAIRKYKVLVQQEIDRFNSRNIFYRILADHPTKSSLRFVSENQETLHYLKIEHRDFKKILDKILFALTTQALSITLDSEEVKLLEIYDAIK